MFESSVQTLSCRCRRMYIRFLHCRYRQHRCRPAHEQDVLRSHKNNLWHNRPLDPHGNPMSQRATGLHRYTGTR